MTKRERLKRCPFCGGKAHVEKIAWFRVVCEGTNCPGLLTYGYYTKHQAEKAWNRRPSRAGAKGRN